MYGCPKCNVICECEMKHLYTTYTEVLTLKLPVHEPIFFLGKFIPANVLLNPYFEANFAHVSAQN